MRILIAAAGSRGDIAPYTGLGAALRAAGHEVALAATGTFEPLVRAAGLDFRALPGNPAEGGGGSGDTDGTDLLLLSTTTAPLGWHLSEATGTLGIGVYLQPTAPTGDFPPIVTGTRSLGRPGNRLAGRFALRMTDRLYAPAVTALRERLGLPPAKPSDTRRRQERADWPVLHGFSPALVPRPTDWRPGLQVVGNWWPHHDPDGQLPAEVADFLGAGAPPVLIGFGSMAVGEGERLSELAVRALRRAKLRGLLQAGSAGLAAEGDDMLTIGDVPHARLFPHLAAVVHHAGAGTSAAALRAGVPAVTVPVTADQPFWAGRLAAVGAADEPIPFRTLTADRLADALDRVVRQRAHGEAAARAAERMAAEDGAAETVEAVRRLSGASVR
ncbi:glycosyltransferase [Streptomyces coelicoflavus]|uniref:glycosyltransferase n=1 Tax=Streptomyces coelicoflavus TaxID=285562 RepID=UPI00368CC451